MSRPHLDNEAKAEICRAYAAGEAIKSIAARFGVHESYPGLLAKRRGLTLRHRRMARVAECVTEVPFQ